MEKKVNLTGHDVVVAMPDGTLQVIPPSGIIARIQTTSQVVGTLQDGTPLTATIFGEPIDLPDPEPNTYYIVSGMILAALPHRKDLLAPNTSPAFAVRNADGQIVSVTAFNVNR